MGTLKLQKGKQKKKKKKIKKNHKNKKQKQTNKQTKNQLGTPTRMCFVRFTNHANFL